MGTCTQARAWLYAGSATGIRGLPAVLLNSEAETTHKRELDEHTRIKTDTDFRIYFSTPMQMFILHIRQLCTEKCTQTSR